MMPRRATAIFAAFAIVIIGATLPRSTCACGGMFSPEATVEQNAMRMIFVDDGSGTITAITQINYEGEAEDFAWVLPLPEPVPAEAIRVVENGIESFEELETRTNPRYWPPERPQCMQFGAGVGQAPEGAAGGAGPGGVDVFASGVTGPYEFDIVGAEDPAELITWLRDHGYAITPEMEPSIDPYIEMGMPFLAMRLLPGEDTSSIEPVAVTYNAEHPDVHIQIAAVSAVPDMQLVVWLFADEQAIPTNYEHVAVPDDQIRFSEYGGDNYRELLRGTVDAAGGHAFVTEFAGPSNTYEFSDPFVAELAAAHPYLTRLTTVLSPEEMTIDPVFDYDSSLPDVDNNHTIENPDAWDIDCVTTDEFTSTAVVLCIVGAGVCAIVGAGVFGITLYLRRTMRKPTGTASVE